MANAIRVLGGGGGSSVSPVQLPEGTGLGSLTSEQYNQIWENLKAGCTVVMVGDLPVTIFSDSLGEMAFFDNYEEPLAIHTIGAPEEPEEEEE